MTRRPRKLGCLLALMAVTHAPTRLGAQEAFPMVCRGGHRMTADYRIATSGPDAGERLVITFFKAPVGANERPPGPGQCAWLDRPLNSAEPFMLHTPVVRPGEGAALRVRYGRVDWPTFRAPYFAYLVEAVGGGKEFRVTAFTNSRGELEIRTAGASAGGSGSFSAPAR